MSKKLRGILEITKKTTQGDPCEKVYRGADRSTTEGIVAYDLDGKSVGP
jgi:hypothetical protein